MKVFVTGATGLVGGSAVRALVAGGHDVVGLTSKAANKAAIERVGARAVVGDMRDANAYRDEASTADAVIHAAAAMPDKMRYSKADVDALMTTDEAAVNALTSAIGPKCRVVLFTSGAWVYGDTGPNPVDETFATDHAYASTKQRAEFEKTLLAKAKAGSVPSVIARPGLIYGNGSLWAKLYLNAMKAKKRAAMPGNGRNTISFIHEDDVGLAYRAIVEKSGAGEVYNLADDAPAPVRDVVNAQARAMDAPPPMAIPGFVLKLVAGPYSAPPLLGHNVLSNRKLKALGFACKYPSYREGVMAVAEAARRG